MTCATNIGGSDLPRVTIDLDVEMAAFDALPDALRRQLRDMAVSWNAAGVRSLIDAHGDDVTIRVLRKIEADMQAAARRRVMACGRS